MNQAIEQAPRRLKVPDRWKGKIHFKWPQKLPDGSTAFPSNADTAARVILDANTPEELEVATVICTMIKEVEAELAMEAIIKRIEGNLNSKI